MERRPLRTKLNIPAKNILFINKAIVRGFLVDATDVSLLKDSVSTDAFRREHRLQRVLWVREGVDLDRLRHQADTQVSAVT